jgi:predicted homoserine dehydrogenase-like protein
MQRLSAAGVAGRAQPLARRFVLHDVHVQAGTLLGRLEERAAGGRPIAVAVVGGGVFASLYLAQALRTPGIHVFGVADLAPGRVRERLREAGWPEAALAAGSAEEARRHGTTWLTDDVATLIGAPGVEVVIEATGDAPAGVEHALRAIAQGRHVVMVNVEADALVGPLLARRAQAAGVVYTLAYGDQPALICELVEWARLTGFEVVCAGKGTKHLPAYHEVTPATVWEQYGLSHEQTAGLNAQMFCSFLDGTKSAVEMAAVANATGLVPQARGLGFPACGTDELARQLRPAGDGGVLEHSGTLEVVSSLRPDGSPVPGDLRWGVYVTIAAADRFVAAAFAAYGLATSHDGRVAALWRPSHLVGLELGISVARAALAGEPTGVARAAIAEVACRAKRDLRAGEIVDGEGGEHVYGVLRAAGAGAGVLLPMGLARGARLLRDVARGAKLTRADVELTSSGAAARLHAELVQELKAGAAHT